MGADINDLGETRKWIIIEWTVLCMRVFGYVWGVPTWKYSKPTVDYSKWLGPDWKPTYDGHTMVVSNHISYIDVFIIFMYIRPMPGFIAKSSIRSVPSVGMQATACGSLFLDRRDKSQKSEVFHKIKER